MATSVAEMPVTVPGIPWGEGVSDSQGREDGERQSDGPPGRFQREDRDDGPENDRRSGGIGRVLHDPVVVDDDVGERDEGEAGEGPGENGRARAGRAARAGGVEEE